MSEADRLRRFLFEDAPVRGHWVRLSRSWIEARAHQPLAPPVRDLLGQSLAASVLLSASLKFSGTMTLQFSGGTGPVTMLVVQATDRRTIRGVAHLADDAQTAGLAFPALVAGGRMVVSVEQAEGGMAWQGIVPMEGDSLARCLESYFASSEQLPTAIVLAADEYGAAGLLLQKLPGSGSRAEAQNPDTDALWEEAIALLATLGGPELLATRPEKLLSNLFGTRDIRLFDAEPVHFACRCDRERVAAMLRGLGREEMDSIIAEQGSITVTCEFCRKPYVFDAVDAAGLFLPPAPASTSLN